jgi:hypothetical protein
VGWVVVRGPGEHDPRGEGLGGKEQRLPLESNERMQCNRSLDRSSSSLAGRINNDHVLCMVVPS